MGEHDTDAERTGMTRETDTTPLPDADELAIIAHRT
jgi:hypothetical protein